MPVLAAPSKASFTSLPLELRNEIYGHLLLLQRTRRSGFQLAILRTNGQIHSEALKIFRENKFVHFVTRYEQCVMQLLASKPVFAFATEQNLSFSYCSMFFNHADLDGRNCPKPPGYITVLESIPILCKTLSMRGFEVPGSLRKLHITIVLQNPHFPDRNYPLPKSLQEQILMPFGILKGLNGLTVTGAKSELVGADLKAAMADPAPTATCFLKEASALKDAGDAACNAGDHHQAIRKYHEAFEAMHISVGDNSIDVHLHQYYGNAKLERNVFASQRGDLVRHQLGSRLSWNLTQAYMKLGSWRKAHLWANRAVLEIECHSVQQRLVHGPPDLITQAERAKVFYQMAVVCKHLGNEEGQMDNLIKAYTRAPNDALICQEVAELRKRLGAEG